MECILFCRFSLIKHETSHMKIVNRCNFSLCLQCDKYIMSGADVSNRHRDKFHKNDEVPRTWHTHTCKLCHLRFRKYKRHMRNYHVHECRKCGIDIVNAKQYADHIEQQGDHDKQLVDLCEQNVDHCEQNVDHCEKNVNHREQNVDQMCKGVFNTKIIRVCDLCYSFLKSSTNLKYYLKGETDDKLGVRYPCDNCGKKYFVLKLVKRLQKQIRQKHRDRKNKILQNEDRLKNIRHRLKKLNLLNKFYFVV